eukprot:6664796-Prymnesium_polylepis.1
MKALTQLKDRKKDFDLVLVETTGLANPAPVVATFTQNPVVANHFRVDGIVCLVDCKYIKEHIEEKREDDQINEAVTQARAPPPSLVAAAVALPRRAYRSL